LASAFLLTRDLQSAPDHQLTGIAVNPDDTVILRVEGSVASSNVFRSYFDLASVEASADLKNWTTVATLLRTNLASNAVSFSDPLPLAVERQFYRLSSNQWHTPLRKPTGPYGVGTTTRLVTDASRTNRFGYKTNSSFMLTYWYPTTPQLSAIPVPYEHPLIAGSRDYWGSSVSRMTGFVAHATSDAAILSGPAGKFPVILYSHGLDSSSGRGVRTENTARALELTSHGFVVVSLDHDDTYGTVFPGDVLIRGRNTDAFSHVIWSHTNRLTDVNFLIDHLVEVNSTDPLLASRLDLDRIGIMGWSFGGGVSADSLRLNNRIRAAALFDGYLSARPDLLKAGVQKPVLITCSPTSGGYAEGLPLFTKATQDAYILQIKNAAHEDFTDTEWLASPTAASRARAAAIDACTVSFFKKHLAGVDDHLLDNPQGSLNEVTSFARK
jgi:dienelactone hydrolase